VAVVAAAAAGFAGIQPDQESQWPVPAKMAHSAVVESSAPGPVPEIHQIAEAAEAVAGRLGSQSFGVVETESLAVVGPEAAREIRSFEAGVVARQSQFAVEEMHSAAGKAAVAVAVGRTGVAGRSGCCSLPLGTSWSRRTWCFLAQKRPFRLMEMVERKAGGGHETGRSARG